MSTPAENPTPIVGGAVSATGDEGASPGSSEARSPAENAAPVRNALQSAMCGEWGKRNALDKLDALLAQAEAAETRVRVLEHDLRVEEGISEKHLDRAEAAEAERDRMITVSETRYERIGALEAERDAAVRTLELSDEDHDIIVAHLEAERDAAVRAAETYKQEIVAIGARVEALDKQTDDMVALHKIRVRQADNNAAALADAAEQAQEALRQIASLPDQSEDWHENDVAVRIARAALTGEGT